MIILTVPHAACDNVGAHPCDSGAPRAAAFLQEALAQKDVQILTGDTPRSVCDLNRIECRQDTAFRQRLSALRPDLVLDIHSYPGWPLESSSFTPYEIVVLLDGGHAASASLSNRIVGKLVQAGVRAAKLEGIRNDIQDEFHERGIPSTLLEFNESLSDSRTREIAAAVAASL